MLLDSESRQALFERIIAAGDRRRRRWLVGPGVVLAVSVLSLTMLPGGDKTRLAVSDDPTTSTTTTAATEPTFETSPATTEPAATTTAAPPTSTTEPLVCRNSHDARCGPFYWDYDPATFPNQPLQLEVTHTPASVVVGEPVEFRIRFFDPDQPGADNCAQFEAAGSDSHPEPGDDNVIPWGCYMPFCGIDQPARYGPWDPPPPPASEPTVRSITRVYESPGDYAVRLEAKSLAMCGFDGYDSEASVAIQVHVVPAPQP